MGRPLINLVGEPFGRLTVIRRVANLGKQPRWLCLCKCGKFTTVAGGKLRPKNGTRSCGCLQVDAGKRTATHGCTNTPTFRSWVAMLSRCEMPSFNKFKDYGARGVKVCERWHDFANFLADMGHRPEGTSIDRFPDMNGNYEPGNCRWATLKEQARNKRNNRLVTVNGETRCVAEWAEIGGASAALIYNRLKRGWDAEEAVFRKAGH